MSCRFFNVSTQITIKEFQCVTGNEPMNANIYVCVCVYILYIHHHNESETANQDLTEVSTFSFNSRIVTITSHEQFKNY